MSDLAVSDGGDLAVPARKVEGTIERVITAIPAPRTRPVMHPESEAAAIAQRAAKRAAVLSGSLALPPGPSCSSRAARGRPTMLERPTITACFPVVSIALRTSSCCTPNGVAGRNPVARP